MKVWALIRDAVETQGSAAMVSVVATAGSVPREQGARLIVTPQGFHGSIGGGALEWHALATAQAKLNNAAGVSFSSHVLGPELGQCCGGRVQLATEVFDRASLDKIRVFAEQEHSGAFSIDGRVPGLDGTEHFGVVRRRLYLFGAGHVGRALVLALAPLSFDVHWVDNRPDAFPRYAPDNVTCIAPADPLAPLGTAPEASMVWVMSHSHALDLRIVDAALRHPSIAHVGLIGSATKRARFEKRLAEAHVTADRIARLICPIGVAHIASKEPAVIALSAAAQLQILHEELLAASGANKPEILPSVAQGATT